MRKPSTRIWVCVALAAGLIARAAVARAADDTARFYGTWETIIPFNGQMVTIVSVHDTSGYKNYAKLATGNTPAGDGTFSATNGKYTTSADKPNDSGTYRFLGDNIVLCTNAAGQTVTWKRDKTPASSSFAAPPPAAEPAAVAYVPDPSLPPETNSAIAAFNKKDYKTAWADFMSAAKKRDSEAEAGVGAMLFNHLNPPGTGFYAQCEKWLQASADQGNMKGMDFLAQYYYATGVAIAGGINPLANHAPLPPALQQQAEGRFALARLWFDRSATKGDVYAAGQLAIMLDSGVGGPRDSVRAAQLRAGVKTGPDADFAKRATQDPGNLAMTAAWQSGHYADALQNAEARAAKGDASAEALLGRAYYEGVGVTRNYATALIWLNKAVDKKNADALFFLGLMNEWGNGVKQDVNKAQALFDEAAGLGQGYAAIEAAGMRMEGAAAAQEAKFATVCHGAGGVADGPLCLVGGAAIDPY